MMLRSFRAGLCLLSVVLACPVGAQEAARTTAGPALVTSSDPLIGFNRSLYDFNIVFDKATLRPTAKFYRAVMPEKAKSGITNALNNLGEPLNFINSMLQGKPNRAFNALGRFVVNSTIGFGGLNDIASSANMPLLQEDFGQTLAVWGVPSGPYLMLPFLGPSNPRDFTGFIVEFIGDPVSIGLRRTISPWASRGATAMYFLDVRQRALSTVDKVLDTSTDPYTALRSAYVQRRNFDIEDGALSANEIANDPFEEAPATPPKP